MKRASLLAAFLLISMVVSATDKFVSGDYGFACSFPGAPQQAKNGETTYFTAYNANRSLFAQVLITSMDLSKVEDMNAFLDEVLTQVLKDMNGTLKSKQHAALQNYPAVRATVLMTLDDGRKFDIGMVVIAVKGKNLTYTVDAGTLTNEDHSGIQPFLDSFEIR